MTPDALAALHAACFTHPRPWSPAEFAALLADPGTVLVADPQGFGLARIVADEAELLTLAVSPAARRRGLGRSLVTRLLTRAAERGAAQMFLEVAADNAPAIALYQQAGFTRTGTRRGYYTRPGHPPADALVMARALPAPGI